jgi:glycosyltransferase involved in cell wall biosynthesis
MRIAIVLQSYGRFGGAERVALSHYVQLRRKNYDVTLFYYGELSPGWKSRLQCETLRAIPSGIARTAQQFKNLFDFMVGLRDFDKIIIHHHVEPMLAFYISKFFGPRVIWYSGSVFELPWEVAITGKGYRSISTTVAYTGRRFYGRIIAGLALSDLFYWFTIQVARTIDAKTAQNFGKIVANSKFLSRFLVHAYDLKSAPPVVYPGPDPLLEKLASQTHFCEQDYILAVGPLIPLKNWDGLIHAASHAKFPKIVFVGEGQEKRRLRDLGARLKVPVEFRGTLNEEEDLARAYGECKILVHPSLYEPFGLTPVEAGLFSKPSIVTNRGGPSEVVVDGETGYLVNPRDHEGIGSKIEALMSDDSLRARMGQRARECITANYTIEQSTTRLLKEIES